MSDENHDKAWRRLDEAELQLLAAEQMVDDWLRLLGALRLQAESGTQPGEREFNETVRSLNKARMLLHEETKKYGRQILANEGLLPDAPLDLDAVRAEIGGRLDRLRDTR